MPHSILRAERATLGFAVGKKFIKNVKNGQFWRVFENLTLQSNSVTRQVYFNRTTVFETHLKCRICFLFCFYFGISASFNSRTSRNGKTRTFTPFIRTQNCVNFRSSGIISLKSRTLRKFWFYLVLALRTSCIWGTLGKFWFYLVWGHSELLVFVALIKISHAFFPRHFRKFCLHLVLTAFFESSGFHDEINCQPPAARYIFFSGHMGDFVI